MHIIKIRKNRDNPNFSSVHSFGNWPFINFSREDIREEGAINCKLNRLRINDSIRRMQSNVRRLSLSLLPHETIPAGVREGRKSRRCTHFAVRKMAKIPREREREKNLDPTTHAYSYTYTNSRWRTTTLVTFVSGLAITDTPHTLFSFLSRRQAPMKKKREKERVASQKRTMPIIGNGRPHLATFALLDVDTGLTDRPVNHRRFNRGVLSRSHASYIYYTVAGFRCSPGPPSFN